VRCFVEPSPAGGYFVRLRGEAAPLSRHDTEEEAEAAAAAYERGLAREDTVEHVPLDDGSEVLIRMLDEATIGAFDPASRERVGLARFVPDAERPHVADVVVDGGRELEAKLLRRLAARAAEQRIRAFRLDDEERALSELLG
jgi:hypothetical protein